MNLLKCMNNLEKMKGKSLWIRAFFIKFTIYLLTSSTLIRAQDLQKNERREHIITVKYKYIFSSQDYEYRRRKLPNVPINHYPLIHYDLDYSSTPNVKIRDRLPSFLKSIAFNYVDHQGQTNIGTIEELSKGKLLILDFWATWCAPCIQSMEKWDSIGKAIPQDVQILGVMLDNNFKAQYFGLEKGWSIPIVFGPEAYIINSFFFDRQVVSRMAWIKDGKLLTITGTQGYDIETVKRVLKDNNFKVPSELEWTYGINDRETQIQ